MEENILWLVFIFYITIVGIKSQKKNILNLTSKNWIVGHKTKHIFGKSSIEDMRLWVIFIGNITIGGIETQKITLLKDLNLFKEFSS